MRVIYLLTLSDLRYAVWKDEVESVRKVETIHRLPFSPACIAGLALIDKRSTALADLAALIGLPPFDRSSQTQLMLIAGQKKDAGFVISGDIVEISIPEESLQPMPAYVATPEISNCIIYQEKPVPVIDLQALYQHIHSRDLNPSIPTLPMPDKHPAPSGITSIKLFTAGGEVFALPAEMVGNTIDKPVDITGIPLTPESLKGVISEGNSVIPVIDLAEKINLPNRGNAEKLLMVEVGGEDFGFLVDDDTGTFSENDYSIHPLPPLAKSSLINAVAIHNQEIIPIVDPIAIIDPDPAKLDDIALADQYQPESDFSGRFNHEEVEVVEFILLGERHALPKAEVGDILPISPFRRVPDLQSLVIGIIEYRGEILPVLDLALVFGRRSLITNDWQMVLINNGDFRAFVVTEAIHQERSLPLNIQKKVPISLPHRLVYGCYPDGNIVRLIVNVKALAVHFDKMVVKNFLSSLTKEMAETAAEIVPALLPAEEVLRLEREANLREIEAQHRPENIPQTKTEEDSPGPGEEAGTKQETWQREPESEEPAESVQKDVTKTEESQQGEAEASQPQKTEQIYPVDVLIVLDQPLESSSAATKDDLVESLEPPKQLSDEMRQPNEHEFGNISENKEDLSRYLAEKLDQLDEVKLHPNEIEKVVLRQDTEPTREKRINEEQARQVALKMEILAQEKLACAKAKEEHLKLEEEAERERARTRKILEQQKRDDQALAGAKEERLKREKELDKQRLATEAEEARSIMREILERQKEKEVLLKAEEARIRLEEKEQAREEAERLRLEIEARNKVEAQIQLQIEERQRLEEIMLARAEEATNKIGKEQETRESEQERVRILAEFRDKKKKDAKDNKRLIILLSLLVILLLDIFIFFGIPEKKQPEPPGSEKGLIEEVETDHGKETKPQVIAPLIKKAGSLPVKPASGPEPKKALKEELHPLTIIVPDNILLTTSTYKVKRGDTLWDISTRFTGNPYNYPFVAQENDIDNPDLIFPEQHILLKRKEKQ